MSFFPRPASPRVLLADIKAFAGDRSPHQWIAAVLAVLMPVGIVVLFYYDSKTNIMPKEQVVYAETWRADRSDEEIRAAQAKRQAAAEKRAKARQQMFKDLERKFGM